MNASQSQAIWEICRQGFPLVAEEAKNLWERGATFQPDGAIPLPRSVRRLVDRCNWEITQLGQGGGAAVFTGAAARQD